MPAFSEGPHYGKGRAVYVLRVSGGSYCKIGMSIDADSRIKNWQMTVPFLNLETVAVYFSHEANQLEGALHKHFSEHRIGSTEWFDLPEYKWEEFDFSVEHWLKFFRLEEHSEPKENTNGRDLNVYPLVPTPPPDLPKEASKPHQQFPIAEPTHPRERINDPRRLTRLPDYQSLKNIPSIQDEFDFGLLPEMWELYEEFQSWEAVGDQYGVSEDIARNVAENEIMPMDNNNRRKFGLCMTYPDFENGAPTFD